MNNETKEKYWSTSVPIGGGREVVYAWERRDRDGKVYVKYSVPSKEGRDRRVKHKLDGDLTVRDAKGRIDKRKERDILAGVRAIAARLQLGQSTRTVATPKGDDNEVRTLHEGFEALLDHASGKFATPTRRWDEVRRARVKLERILGQDMLWTDINPRHARVVWRKLAEESKRLKEGERGTGARQAEVTVDALYSTANWLRSEGRIDLTAALAVKGWRRHLFDDWERMTGSKVKVLRPRHTAEEMRKLFAHLNDPRVDPRFALAFDLGGEQRMGQVLRCWRSDLELAVVALDAIATAAPGSLGILHVASVGKKLASPIMLTASQRVAVDAAVAGYLSNYENAYRAGEIDDYPLFPAGRFKEGKAKLVPSAKSLDRDGARKMFHKLEEIAGVKSLPGRAWYGVRRVAADLAEDVTKDERILNSITGHKDSATRRLYQEPERVEILRGAAETRDKVRRGNDDGSVPITPQASKNSA